MVLGVTSGLLVMALIAATGWVVINLLSGPETIFQVLLAIDLFAAQFAAGYVAGRFSGASQAFHGSLAGAGFYALFATFSIIDGSRAGALDLALLTIVSAVLGGAGGLLAGRPDRETDGSPA